jgi:hypothetical protein
MGLLNSFYHNPAAVNKKFRRVLGGDFDNRSGSDYGSNRDADEENCRFKYTQIYT